MRFVVVFDACVLYPAPMRDFLVRLATAGLFAAKGTDRIHDEWTRSLLATRPDLADALKRTRSLMDQAVPDCLVEGYEPLIGGGPLERVLPAQATVPEGSGADAAHRRDPPAVAVLR